MKQLKELLKIVFPFNMMERKEVNGWFLYNEDIVRHALIELIVLVVMLSIFLWTKYHKKARVFKYINNMNLQLVDADFKTLYDFSLCLL